MASPGGLSGTYAFNPSLGETVLYAYGLCGIRRAQILQEHMADARFAANLVLVDWLNQGVNLWQVEELTIPLVQGTASYSLPANVLNVLDAYVTSGPSFALTDRTILPVSRTEYASYPNKAQQGQPTVFWMDRLLSPTVTLWPVPDGQETSVTFYVLRQAQDANLTSGQQVEAPYAWLSAFAMGLAAKLAFSYAQDKLAVLVPAAKEVYQIAANTNIETANTFISPMLSRYYR